MTSLLMTSKGRVTIPVDIRRRLGLNPGDRVLFIERDGKVFVERDADDIGSLFGMFNPTRSADLKKIEGAARSGWTRRAKACTFVSFDRKLARLPGAMRLTATTAGNGETQ